jgi:phosphatidyl-myo-inositol dimannoside synthase
VGSAAALALSVGRNGSPERAGLAVITLKQGGDGVAFAGLLLEHALQRITNAPLDVLQLAPAITGKPSAGEQVRFASSLLIAQLGNRERWWLFNHVGIARAQNLVPRLIRKPYAVLLCGIEAWDPALSSDRKRTLRDARVRIAISQYTASRVAQAHPDVGSIVACPLALLPIAPAAATLEHAMLAKIRPNSVLIVGRMSSAERYKGHDELLDSWSAIVREVPDAQLVVAGQGDDLTRLREKATSLGLGDSVLFLGFVPEGTLETLRARVALFALPSRGEGFGLVYLEAMRAGLSCIGGANDAAADLIVHGETGLLVDPLNSEDLAGAVLRLLRSPELRAQYGAAGKRRFDSEFTFERYCDRLEPILTAAFS